MLKILLRKTVSFCVLLCRKVLMVTRIIIARLVNQDAVIPWSTQIESGVCMRVTDGGKLVLGEAVHIGANSLIIARRGVITIGDNSIVGRGCVIACQESITIGVDALVGEYVSIRDQDHNTSAGADIVTTGYKTSRVTMGAGVWIGAKASILRGSAIGDGAVIGAHTLVRGDIPEMSVAVGSPARIVKRRE